MRRARRVDSPGRVGHRLLAAALCAATTVAGACRSLDDPFPFTVAQVHGPAELTVRFPYGPETLHLQYVSSRESDGTGRGKARLERLVRAGVDVRPQLGFPLACDQTGRRQALVYRPGSRRSVNEELLEAGGARFDSLPVGLGYVEAAECIAAARRAAWARPKSRRAGGGPGAIWSIGAAEAAKELEAARRLLAGARGVVSGEPLRVRIVGAKELAREQSRVLGGVRPTVPVGRLEAFAPPGPEIFLASPVLLDSLPGTDRRRPIPPREILRVVLLHEVVHKVQYAFGMHPLLVRRGHASLALIEGHAAYWAYRLAERVGLALAAELLLSAGAKYTEGFAVWRHIYARLRAAGHRVDLALDGDPLVVAVHRALLGPGGPADREALLDPDAWLAEHVAGWPAAPAWIALAGAVRHDVPRGGDGRGVEVRWRIETAPDRNLFLQAERVSTIVERRSEGGWHQFGSPRTLRRGAGRLRLLVEAGGLGVLPARDRRLSSWLEPFDLRAAARTRIRLVVEGLAVSYTEGAERLTFGRLSSPWLAVSAVLGTAAVGPSAPSGASAP